MLKPLASLRALDLSRNRFESLPLLELEHVEGTLESVRFEGRKKRHSDRGSPKHASKQYRPFGISSLSHGRTLVHGGKGRDPSLDLKMSTVLKQARTPLGKYRKRVVCSSFSFTGVENELGISLHFRSHIEYSIDMLTFPYPRSVVQCGIVSNLRWISEAA